MHIDISQRIFAVKTDNSDEIDYADEYLKDLKYNKNGRIDGTIVYYSSHTDYAMIRLDKLEEAYAHRLETAR